MEFLVTWLVSLILFMVVPFKSIPNEITPYYNEFIEIVQKECPKAKPPMQFGIYFKKLKNEEVGLCTLYTFKSKIEIDEFFWATSDNRTRRQLVFHELTHCILETHHVEDIQNYMYPYMVYVPEEQLTDQVKQVAKDYCN